MMTKLEDRLDKKSVKVKLNHRKLSEAAAPKLISSLERSSKEKPKQIDQSIQSQTQLEKVS